MTYKDLPALNQETVLEAQWSDLPEDVVEEVRQMWQRYELGNDDCYWRFIVSEEKLDNAWPLTVEYLEKHNVENCLIHFWW